MGLGTEGDGHLQGSRFRAVAISCDFKARIPRQIRQTPDLTSLSPEHLPDETLDKLPYLCKLKESIYSK